MHVISIRPFLNGYTNREIYRIRPGLLTAHLPSPLFLTWLSPRCNVWLRRWPRFSGACDPAVNIRYLLAEFKSPPGVALIVRGTA